MAWILIKNSWTRSLQHIKLKKSTYILIFLKINKNRNRIFGALIGKTEEKIFAYISLEPPCKRNKQKRKEKIAFLSVIYIFQKHKPECYNRRLLSPKRRAERERFKFSSIQLRYSTHTSLLNNAKRSPESPGIFFFAGDDGRFGGETVCFYSYVEMWDFAGELRNRKG